MAKKVKLPKTFKNKPTVLIGTGFKRLDQTLQNFVPWGYSASGNAWYGQFFWQYNSVFRPVATLKYKTDGPVAIFTVTAKSTSNLKAWFDALSFYHNGYATIDSFYFTDTTKLGFQWGAM